MGSPCETPSTSTGGTVRRLRAHRLHHAQQRVTELALVELEIGPARREPGPGGDVVPREQSPAPGPVEDAVPRRVPGRVDGGHGPDLLPVRQVVVDPAGRVPGAEREPEPHGKEAPRRGEAQRHRVGLSLAAHDVRLPLVGVDCGAAQDLEPRKTHEVGAVGVRQQDVLEVINGLAEPVDLVQDEAGVRVGEGIYEGQPVLPVVEQVRAGVAAKEGLAARPMSDAVYSSSYLHRPTPPEARVSIPRFNSTGRRRSSRRPASLSGPGSAGPGPRTYR